VAADPPAVHPVAARGFGQNAEDYERARPGYSPEAVAFLVSRLDLRPGRTVLDVGAGTGKLTRLLVPTGVTVVAVEPVAAMRAELARVVPEARVYDATADRLPVDTGSMDAIVCSQAFHWFATAEVLREFARVVAPGGALALVWNVRDASVPWIRQFSELLQPYEGDRPDHNSGDWQAPFTADAPFGELHTTTFSHEQPMTPELLVARAASMSFVGVMDEPTRARVLGQIRQLGAAQGDAFGFPYTTDVHLSVRR
jgi:SAM-dependent methyltransferase